MRQLRSTIARVLVAGGIVLAACGGAVEATRSAEGVVRQVDRENAQITIQHGEIEGLMKAMTMTFDVSDPSLLQGIDDGDEVRFGIRYADGAYTVTAIERL